MKFSSLAGALGVLLGATTVLSAQYALAPGTLAGPLKMVAPSSFAGANGAIAGVKPDIAQVEDPRQKRIRRIWIASIAAMAAGTAADGITSWHKRESNGLLASADGTFGAKGVGVKAGITAGVLLPQLIFRKHKDWRGAFAVGNFAEAGIFAGAAVHNLNVK